MTDVDYADDSPMLAHARGDDFAHMMAPQQRTGELIVPGTTSLSPRQVGDLFGTLTTAQPVIKDRDIGRLMQTLKALAQTFGDSYVYSWDVKDKNSKRGDGKTTIEGPTIQLANDLAREYGNCCLDIREIEGPTHWVFYGRFIDLQTGYTLTRAFRQRKNALAGKYEDDRKLDMSYQMGQSKCLRNVVINALRNYAEFMMEEAKNALPDKIAKNPEKYAEAIRRGLAQYGVAEADACKMVGRAMGEWTHKDMARVFGALKAIAEGLTTVAEVFPKDGPVVDEETGEVHNEQTRASPMSGGAKSSAAPAKAAAAANPGEAKAPASSSPSPGQAPHHQEPEGDERPAEPRQEAKAEPAPKAQAASKPAPATPPKGEQPAKKQPAKKPGALFTE